MTCGLMHQDGGGKPLNKLSKKDLYSRAKNSEIKGRSKMSKDELVVSLREHYKKVGEAIRRRTKGKKSA